MIRYGKIALFSVITATAIIGTLSKFNLRAATTPTPFDWKQLIVAPSGWSPVEAKGFEFAWQHPKDSKILVGVIGHSVEAGKSQGIRKEKVTEFIQTLQKMRSFVNGMLGIQNYLILKHEFYQTKKIPSRLRIFGKYLGVQNKNIEFAEDQIYLPRQYIQITLSQPEKSNVVEVRKVLDQMISKIEKD